MTQVPYHRDYCLLMEMEDDLIRCFCIRIRSAAAPVSDVYCCGDILVAF